MKRNNLKNIRIFKDKRISKINKLKSQLQNCYSIKNLSDGYHTFEELYEFRKLYNAALFNEWANQDKFNVQKSKRHSDGNLCFDGDNFIVVAELPTGQISNHYKLKDWDLFKIPAKEICSIKYDNHTPEDVTIRLTKFLNMD
jgi:hypothetical protein